jgi:hypothetical protein
MDQRLNAALNVQARACAELGSGFTARLMQVLAEVWPEDTALAALVAGWPGDIGPRAASLPLRIAGGLHALVLAGKAPGLAQVYPPLGGDLRGPVLAALRAQDAALCDWVQSAPQTNEVGRSAVLLAGAAEVVAWSGGLPLQVSELGASAGLNLWFDRYALAGPWGGIGAAGSAVTLRPDWQGAAAPLVPVRVAERRGVDLNPLDPGADGARLVAFVWPDQADRLARLRAALSLAEGGMVDRGDAADWLAGRLRAPVPGRVHLVCHTVAHQYFPAATQDRIEDMMQAAGAAATAAAPLAWLGMEADGNPEGAGVTLRLWPGDQRVALGRAGFHGQWVRWTGLG